jgi:hypothetical protein
MTRHLMTMAIFLATLTLLAPTALGSRDLQASSPTVPMGVYNGTVVADSSSSGVRHGRHLLQVNPIPKKLADNSFAECSGGRTLCICIKRWTFTVKDSVLVPSRVEGPLDHLDQRVPQDREGPPVPRQAAV